VFTSPAVVLGAVTAGAARRTSAPSITFPPEKHIALGACTPITPAGMRAGTFSIPMIVCYDRYISHIRKKVDYDKASNSSDAGFICGHFVGVQFRRYT